MWSDPKWLTLFLTTMVMFASAVAAWVRMGDRVQRLEEKLSKHLETAEPSIEKMNQISSEMRTLIETIVSRMEHLDEAIAQHRGEQALANRDATMRIDRVFEIVDSRRRSDA